jgi:hypothetical protein
VPLSFEEGNFKILASNAAAPPATLTDMITGLASPIVRVATSFVNAVPLSKLPCRPVSGHSALG